MILTSKIKKLGVEIKVGFIHRHGVYTMCLRMVLQSAYSVPSKFVKACMQLIFTIVESS